MERKAEEEPIVEVSATTATPRDARPAGAQQAGDLQDIAQSQPTGTEGAWTALETEGARTALETEGARTALETEGARTASVTPSGHLRVVRAGT